jgi:iron complex outermembrane receptor protein
MHKSCLAGARAFLVGSVAVISISAAAAAQNTADLALQPQPMADALRSVAEITHANIMFTPEAVAGVRAPSVSGRMDAAQAVNVLTKGSDLEVVADGWGGLIVRRPSAHIMTQAAADVGGSAPAPENVEQVTVTGSRVISSVAQSPTPLTVVTAEQLQSTTPTNIPDALNKLPVFLGSGSQRNVNNASTNAAGNTLNLRNFGAQRTLVLLDGHRVTPSNADGTVDTDVLPQMLMSRVDVVTGGASAVYGSDAVTGVVNFVLDKNFDGFKYNFNAGTSNDTLGTQYQGGAAWGTSLFDGRGHFETAVRYFHQDAVPITSLSYGQRGQAWSLAGTGTAANPYVPVQFGRTTAQPFGGLVNCACAANGMTFVQNGILGPFNAGTPTGSPGLNAGGQGSYDTDGSAQAALRTAEAFGRFSYNINDDITAYIQGTAAESGNYATWYPLNISPGANRPNTFYTNNAFLTPAAQAALSSGNATGTFQLPEQIQAFSNGDAYPQKRVFATGSVDRNLAVTAGISGQAFHHYDWDLYFTHGESRQEEYNPSNTNNQKWYAAQDAVQGPNGTVVCNVSTTAYASLYPGCTPFNAFGPSSASPEAYDYLSQRTQFVLTNIMDDVGGSVSGELFSLPAGPVKAALSAEARWLSYTVNSNASPTSTVNCTGLRLCSTASPLWIQNVVASVNASENVYEFAGEVNVPILKSVPLVQELSADLAGRITNYSTSGEAETWKIGLDYHVDDNIRFRGTASVDIRAPTLNDLYSPLQVSPAGLTDILTNQTFSAPLHAQGNSTLKPEVAHTYTAGVVFTPDFISNLTVSVDYYRIDLSNGITNISYATPAIQTICINSIGTSALSPYCSLANRPIALGAPGYTSPANYPNYFVSEALNSANVKTEGVDIEADYNFDMADIAASLPGSVSLRGLLSLQPYINTLTYPGGATTMTSMPKSRFTSFLTYNIGSWGINLQDSWESSYNRQTLPTQVYAQQYVGEFNVLDATVDRKFDLDGADTDFYLSVQNVGNVQAPLVPNGASNPGLFYPVARTFGGTLGRYFTIGVRGNF